MVALLPFTHARSESINADSLNSNFVQLGRSGSPWQQTVYPRRSPVNCETYCVSGIEPTFRLLVGRTTSSATETTSIVVSIVHMTKNINIKEETKTNKRQCPVSPVWVQDPWRQNKWNQEDYGGKNLCLCGTWVLSLRSMEWRRKQLIPQVRQVENYK